MIKKNKNETKRFLLKYKSAGLFIFNFSIDSEIQPIKESTNYIYVPEEKTFSTKQTLVLFFFSLFLQVLFFLFLQKTGKLHIYPKRELVASLKRSELEDKHKNFFKEKKKEKKKFENKIFKFEDIYINPHILVKDSEGSTKKSKAPLTEKPNYVVFNEEGQIIEFEQYKDLEIEMFYDCQKAFFTNKEKYIDSKLNIIVFSKEKGEFSYKKIEVDKIGIPYKTIVLLLLSGILWTLFTLLRVNMMKGNEKTCNKYINLISITNVILSDVFTSRKIQGFSIKKKLDGINEPSYRKKIIIILSILILNFICETYFFIVLRNKLRNWPIFVFDFITVVIFCKHVYKKANAKKENIKKDEIEIEPNTMY